MHLLMVIEKKSYNFVDHVSDGKSLEEKKELCAQFAKYN